MVRILTTDIDPDGVPIHIPWEDFKVGTTIFIPTLNPKIALSQVKKAGGFDGRELAWSMSVENGLYGIRIWRVKWT